MEKVKKEETEVKTAGDVIACLRTKFPPSEYALLQQVANSTGYNIHRRWADAIVMGLWPSRGLEVIGIEIKVRRSDWIKEKKNPAKAEEIAQYCDQWCVAVANENIVQDGELPQNWGLLIPRKGSMRFAVIPKALKPKPLNRDFLAAVFRNLQLETPEFRLAAEYARGVTEGRNQEQARHEEYCRAVSELKGVKINVAEFEKASGVAIHQWYGPEKIGLAVRMVLDGSYLRELERLIRIKTSLHEAEQAIGTQIEKLQLSSEQVSRVENRAPSFGETKGVDNSTKPVSTLEN